MVGVIPNTEGICLMIAQVFDERGENSDSFIDEAVEWCADNGARVINMSLGTTVSHKESKELYNKLWEEGIIVVAAAGNSGSSVKAYPASYDDVISVSAVDELNELAVFSSFNKQVNLAAPGVDILSTVGGKQISVEDGSGKEIDGDLMKYSVLPDEDDISDLEIVDCGQGFEKCKADGKVCLIERGETFFWEKAENCEKGKGVAALIYNNLDEALIGNLSRDHEIKIPVVSLSRQDGLALLESGGTMSLSIKPYGYYSMDGTSMAAPHEDCGITAEERAVGFSWPYWARQKCKADFYPPGPNQRKRHGKRHGNKKNRGNKKKQQVAHEEGSRYPPKLPPMHFNDLAARSMTSTAVNPKHSSA